MAAPGPHRVEGVRRSNSLVASFRRLRTEWSKYKDGHVMKRAEEPSEEDVQLVRSQSEDASDHRVGSFRRRNSFSSVIKKLRREWIGGEPGERRKEDAIIVLHREEEGQQDEVVPAYRVLRAHKQPKRRRHSTGEQRTQTVCSTPNCPCGVAKEFTANLLEADKERNCKQRTETQTQDTSECAIVEAPLLEQREVIQWDRPKLADVKRELAVKERKSAAIVVHRSFSDSGAHTKEPLDSLRVLECSTRAVPYKHQSGCTNPECTCSVVKEYTERILAEDEEKKKLRTNNKMQTSSPGDLTRVQDEATPPRLGSRDLLQRSTSTSAPSSCDRDASARPRRASEPSRKTQRPPPPLDRDTLRRLAKEYRLKKQEHRTKWVVCKDAEKRSWRVNKYKSLVEISDSIPDLLQAALEDKEQRREERKDSRWHTKKTIIKTVHDAALSSSDYAMRRRTPVPHYHSFPTRNTPAIPVLMSKLPNPPAPFRENSV